MALSAIPIRAHQPRSITALAASPGEVVVAGKLQANLAQTHAILLKGNAFPGV
jgi:hypothetical protein